ncbi:MAG: DUF1015 domain-containing protein [Chlorobi bacterium]|nr:DUF1015 domain-containing protein [Chlorobiota bacterium]
MFANNMGRIVIDPLSGYVARPQLAHLIALPSYELLVDDQKHHLHRFNPYSIEHFMNSQPDPDYYIPVSNAFLVYEHTFDGKVSRGLIGLLRLTEEVSIQDHEKVFYENLKKIKGYFLGVGEQRFPLMIVSSEEWHVPEPLEYPISYENIRGDRIRMGWIESEHPVELSGELFLADGHHRWGALQQLYQEGKVSEVLVWLLPPSMVRVRTFKRLVKGIGEEALLEHFSEGEHELVMRGEFGERKIYMQGDVLSLHKQLESFVIERGGEVFPLSPYEHSNEGIVVEFPDVSLSEVWGYAREFGTLPPKTTWFEPKMDMGLVRVPLK